MEPMQAGELAIQPHHAAGVLQLHWRGKSNAREPGAMIAPYLERVFAASVGDGSAIEMHFEELQHFNSSTITVVIQAIQQARARGVRLILVYSASLKWQRLSFEALRVFVKGDGTLELRAV
jgi:hypothetical protein